MRDACLASLLANAFIDKQQLNCQIQVADRDRVQNGPNISRNCANFLECPYVPVPATYLGKQLLIKREGRVMSIDPNTLLTFCRAVEETTDVGLLLFGRQDLLATIGELEALRAEVDRALLQLTSLPDITVH